MKKKLLAVLLAASVSAVIAACGSKDVPSSEVSAVDTHSEEKPQAESEEVVAAVPEGPVDINETNFPDEIFRNYIKDNFDTNSDSVLSVEELGAITEIDVDGYGIESVKGIEFFYALEKLDADNNKLSSIDVSRNTALKTLYLYTNELTSIDVSKNLELDILHLDYNNITELDISHNSLLRNLHTNSCPLTYLDLSNHEHLYWVECEQNQLTGINLTNCTGLGVLYCWNNQLTELDLSACTKLKDLVCFGNQITTIDVSHVANVDDMKLLTCDDGVTIIK